MEKNVVKLVFNKNKKLFILVSGRTMTFGIKKKLFFHHLDTISFKPNALKKFSKFPQGDLKRLKE